MNYGEMFEVFGRFWVSHWEKCEEINYKKIQLND